MQYSRNFSQGFWQSDRVPQENLVINGNFAVAQRGTAFPSPEDGDYTLDRWRWGQSGAGRVDIRQAVETPDEFTPFCLEVEVAKPDRTLAGSAAYTLQQRIEGHNTAHLAFGSARARPVTLSFDVRSPKTGVHHVCLANEAGNRTFPARFAICAPNAWERHSITFPGCPSGQWTGGTGIGITVAFVLAVGGNALGLEDTWNADGSLAGYDQVNVLDGRGNRFAIANVKLEQGPVATDFMADDFAGNLMKCLRYAYVQESREEGGTLAAGLFQSKGQARVFVPFPVPLRARPALGHSSPHDFAVIATETNVVDAISYRSTGLTGADLTFHCVGEAEPGQGCLVEGGRRARLVHDAEL